MLKYSFKQTKKFGYFYLNFFNTRFCFEIGASKKIKNYLNSISFYMKNKNKNFIFF